MRMHLRAYIHQVVSTLCMVYVVVVVSSPILDHLQPYLVLLGTKSDIVPLNELYLSG